MRNKLSAILLFSICTIVFSQVPLNYSAIDSSASEQIFGSNEKIPFSLVGFVYNLPRGTSRLPEEFDVTESVGKVYTNVLDIPTRSFSDGFPGLTNRFEWFAIDYHGFFAINSSDWHEFILESDDGSKLFIDGAIVINNDGTHSPMKRKGSVLLEEGIHRMNVQYFQGPRHQIALRLFYKTSHEPYFQPFNFNDFMPLKIEKGISAESIDSNIVSIEINSSVLFAFDDYQLKSEAMLVLDEIVDAYLLDKPDLGMVIEGHTDDMGSDAYNLLLAENRAKSVKNYFEGKHMLSGRIWKLSYGETKPKYENNSDKNRTDNRRVEILIMTTEKAKEYYSRHK